LKVFSFINKKRIFQLSDKKLAYSL